MRKKEAYNEAVEGDEGFIPGEGYPSFEGEPCVNVSDQQTELTDTMTDAADGGETLTGMGETDSGSGRTEADDVARAAAEWQDKFLRLQAEFDNYRKRTLREKMELVQTGGRDVLLEMLPVRDDVQRAMEAMEKSDDLEALRTGVRLIAQKFTEALRRKGVTEIEVKGREFDAEEAEAVARFAAGEQMKGKVIDVVQTGYMLGDKVLRFAKVVVGE